MGLFDSVYADCPRCGLRNEFQTKADVCPYMNSYDLADAPLHLLVDVLDEPHWCAGCKSWFALIDPDNPPLPRKQKPRPAVVAVAVREPEAGEYHSYRNDPDALRWWQAPFTVEDIVPTPAKEPTP